MPARTTERLALSAAFAAGWLAYFAALQWSVVRYRVPIVAVLTAATVALALWQWRGWQLRLSSPAVAAMLAGSALCMLAVPLFSYLAPTGLAVATTSLVLAPLVAALLLWSPGRDHSRAGALVAVAGYAVGAATAVVSDPAPRIDVWVLLQQASDALLRGENFYAMDWTGSPGVKDAFTYLPWTAVLVAPGRWLLGDVRWALLVWMVVAAVGIWRLAHTTDIADGGRPSAAEAPPAGRGEPAASSRHTPPSRSWLAAAAIALVLLAPGTLTQVDQSWTEPLLLAALVWWAVLVNRGQAWWAVIPLALACASKQHLALLLPVLLLWRGFGARRAVATGALTGVLIAPWFIASPTDFVSDTVTLLVSFHPIRFANTLYLLALNTFGVTLPFFVTGVVVLGTLGAVALTVWRRQPPLDAILRWLALVLLVANLVNKQAFYNQFWLVGSLVVTSLVLAGVSAPAATRGPARSATRDRDGWRRTRSATTSGSAG